MYIMLLTGYTNILNVVDTGSNLHYIRCIPDDSKELKKNQISNIKIYFHKYGFVANLIAASQ